MKLYDDIQETEDFNLSGGEKIRFRFRHDDFETMIATDNVSEDPEVYKRCAPLPEPGDAEGIKKLAEEAETAAAEVKAADKEIAELLRKRSEKVAEFVTFSRTLRVMEAAAAIDAIECTDWTDAKEALTEAGKRNVVFAAVKQNKVYRVELAAYHEKMGEQFRLAWQAVPSNPFLSDAHSVAHETKIPDYVSKEDMLFQYEDMKEYIDSKFFKEENPVIERRNRLKLTVDGIRIPGYQYE